MRTARTPIGDLVRSRRCSYSAPAANFNVLGSAIFKTGSIGSGTSASISTGGQGRTKTGELYMGMHEREHDSLRVEVSAHCARNHMTSRLTIVWHWAALAGCLRNKARVDMQTEVKRQIMLNHVWRLHLRTFSAPAA